MLYLVDTNYSEPDSLQYIFHDEEVLLKQVLTAFTQQGTFINMHIPNECVRKYAKKFKEGQVYRIKNFWSRLMCTNTRQPITTGEFWIGGKIVAVENSYNWFAVCCQPNDCNSRLIPLPSGEYECKKCLTNWTKGIDKYNLKLQVEDANGNAKLKLVDKDCIQLIGRTTSDLRAEHRRITPQLPKEIQSLVGLGMLFMVEVQREQLENRYAPFSVTKIINDQTLVSIYCSEVIKKQQNNWYLEPEEGDINLLDEVDY
nr:replication factor A protein 1-like [Ipomoea batatas]